MLVSDSPIVTVFILFCEIDKIPNAKVIYADIAKSRLAVFKMPFGRFSEYKGEMNTLWTSMPAHLISAQ